MSKKMPKGSDVIMRSSLAYVLAVNEADKTYIEINRLYEYIGYNTKSLGDIVEDLSKWKRFYLYNDGCTPYSTFANYNKWYDKKMDLIDSMGLTKFQKK